MGIFGQGLGGIGSVLSVLLPFLFVLTIVVFIHELGHFAVARDHFGQHLGPRAGDEAPHAGAGAHRHHLIDEAL